MLNLCLYYKKRTIRVIYNKPFLAHTNVLFKECKKLKLSEINTLCAWAYMHITRNILELIGTQDYLTRNRESLLNTRERINITQQNFGDIGLEIRKKTYPITYAGSIPAGGAT